MPLTSSDHLRLFVVNRCVSVHRRDRCTGVSSSLRVWCCGLMSFVRVCMSIDVTGALVPFLHYFGPALLFHVHAPPPCAMILNCTTTTPFTKVKRHYFPHTFPHGICRPLVPFVVLWSPWCVALLGSWSRFLVLLSLRLLFPWFCCAPL